jgi:hypothetical protein
MLLSLGVFAKGPIRRKKMTFTNIDVKDSEIMTNDNQSSAMYENAASMYQENIYENAV